MKTTGVILSPITYGRNAPAALPALFYDGSRNSLDGTFAGGLVAGDWALINNSIYVPLLNGTTDYITIPDNPLLSFGRTVASSDIPFSIVAWINMTDATEFPIIKKGVYNTNGEWRMLVDASDMLNFQLFDESVADCYIGRKTAALNGDEGTWICVGASCDGSETSAGINIYRNGVDADNGNSELNAGSYVAMENNGAAVEIGKDATLFASGYISSQMQLIRELKDATWFNAFYNQTRAIYGV